MTRSSDPILKLGKLSFSAGGNTIIDSIDLDIERGEFVGLIGPNGAGKTSLLKLILGLYKADKGSIDLNGRDLNTYPPRERAAAMAYLSQSAGTSFSFPVLDVVAMGRYPFLKRFKSEGHSDIEEARRALAYVGLAGFEERHFTELSSGEQQLVLFAQVLVQNTGIILLDEPTSNLDIKHRDLLFSMTEELAREKRAIIAAVHNLNAASQYCSRLVLLSKGKKNADGKPRDVLKPDLLDRVYDTETAVTTNVSTGSLTVSVVHKQRKGRGPVIHLIGGAGSAVNLSRELSRMGFSISGGIAHAFDADAKLWESLDIPRLTVDAFSAITEDDVENAAPLVRHADLTILGSFPFGPGNIKNLILAGMAKRLVIVSEGGGELERTFYSKDGEEEYTKLKERARIMSHAELTDALENGALLREKENREEEKQEG